MTTKQQQKGAKDRRVAVPMDPGDRAQLEKRARDNGRNIGREAAHLIKRALRQEERGGQV